MNTVFATQTTPIVKADFRAYLERSLRDPFTLNLRDCTLIEIIRACVKAKSTIRPKYGEGVGSLMYNLELLQKQYHVVIYPVQVTDVFWGYFISFLQGRGLRATSIAVICSKLRSILNWAVKYNAPVSPTYSDILIPTTHHQGVALTADEVSRVTYFDVERFYRGRRKDFRDTMTRIRDLFVLSCNLGQRYSDCIRIEPSCFERNVFSIVQQKTGSRAVVNIDKLAVEPKTTYRILERYGYNAPYKSTIGNYNYGLHQLMKDVGLTDMVRDEEKIAGKVVTRVVPKYEKISSHVGRRSFVSINVMRGRNIMEIRRATAHSDTRAFQGYVVDLDD